MFLQKKAGLLIALVLLIKCGIADSNYQIKNFNLTTGVSSSNSGYTLLGSIGQSITAKSNSQNYQINSGFWQMNTDLIFKNDFE